MARRMDIAGIDAGVAALPGVGMDRSANRKQMVLHLVAIRARHIQQGHIIYGFRGESREDQSTTVSASREGFHSQTRTIKHMSSGNGSRKSVESSSASRSSGVSAKNSER